MPRNTSEMTALRECRSARSALLCAQHLHRQHAHAGQYTPECRICWGFVEAIIATDDLCKYYQPPHRVV